MIHVELLHYLSKLKLRKIWQD